MMEIGDRSRGNARLGRAAARGLLLTAGLLLPLESALAEAVCLASVTVERNWVSAREAGTESSCDFDTELVSNILFIVEDNDIAAPRRVQFGYNVTLNVITADEEGTFESRETQESRELIVELGGGVDRSERQEQFFAACKFGWKHVTLTERPVESVEVTNIAIGDVICTEP